MTYISCTCGFTFTNELCRPDLRTCCDLIDLLLPACLVYKHWRDFVLDRFWIYK